MLLPEHFSFSTVDQMLLTSSTARRLLMACAMGGIVGLEREWRHKASGLRTNMLICMGSAMFTMLSAVLAGDNSPNKGQVASNIVQGIGFLGAGLILHTKSRVLGLTSAATVWVVAAIGMACGAGLYMVAAMGAVIVFLALELIGFAETGSRWKRYPLIYEVRGKDQHRIYVAILSVLDRAGFRLNVMEKDSIAALERVSFTVTANRMKHTQLIHELKVSDATDHVVTFRDADED
jgi:putative Mg2+ transporter-C (MgtC) family protein